MLLLNKAKGAALRLRDLRRGYSGYVDGIQGDQIIGWVASTRMSSTPIKVEVRAGERHVTKVIANLERKDVAAAGFGTGHHGFVVPLTDALMIAAVETGGKLTLNVSGCDFAIGTVMLDEATMQSVRLRNPKVTQLQDPKHNPKVFQDLLYGECLDAFRMQGKLPHIERAEVRPHSRMFGRKDYVNGSDLPVPMFSYADYVRYRFCRETEFDLDADPLAAANFIEFYLSVYCTFRNGLRAPLPRYVIDYLNEPLDIPGHRTRLTRASWAFFFRVPPIRDTTDFNNPDWVNWVIYWWAVNQARTLFCEDCLVPDSYAEAMLAPARNAPWQDQAVGAPEVPFVLSEFLARYANEDPALAALDLSQPEGRKTLVLFVMARALHRPDFLRYVPHDLREALLDDSEGESAFSAFYRDLAPVGAKPISRSDYIGLLRLRNFDLDRLAFDTFTDEGHRLDAVALSKVPSETPVDVQMIGPFHKASGLGQATRLSGEIMRHTGLSINQVDFDLDNPAPEGFSSDTSVDGHKPAKVNLIHLNAESIPLAYAYQPDVFSEAYNIGYVYWELDSPAACHYLALDLLDEIWVSSDYCRDIYLKHTDKPVVNVGMCYEELPEIDRDKARQTVIDKTGFGTDDFVFIVGFDSYSFIQRKNPAAVLAAFAKAFDGISNAKLLIKTQNKTKIVHSNQIETWKELDKIIEADERIALIDETMQYKDFLTLKAGSDCYVSLHASEGWGFGMIEAMRLGVPVIATGYSGNMDFCSQDTAWLVDYELTAVEPDDYIFVREGQKWAIPDAEAAAKAMFEAYSNADLRVRKAQSAQKFISANFSPDAISHRYKARLLEIEKLQNEVRVAV